MTRKALKPPIEPLSEETCQRIEDAVIDRLRWERAQPKPSRQPRMALLLAAASLGISAVAVAMATGLFSPSSKQALGTHQTRSAHDVATAVIPGPVADGPTVRFAPTQTADEEPAGRVILTTGDEPTRTELGGSELLVAPRSKVSYRGSDAEGWLVVVESGRVGCEVAPRQGRPDFVVRAGTAEVRVIGTRFEVAYEDGQASVSVDEGKVLVLDDGHRMELRSGQTWPPLTARQTAPDQEESHASRERGASSASAREDYELAASLESSEPARALSIYRRLSSSKGPWAANALYAQARLLKESGRESEAKGLLSRYLKLYPRGANAADARRLLDR